MSRFGPVGRAATFGVAVFFALMLVACGPQGPDGSADVVEPPSKGLEAVTAQQILKTRPTGVTPGASYEEPADGGVVRFNAATRTFAAATEAAAAAAAGQLRRRALDDGWTGGGFEDPGGGGVPTATLTKRSLVLEISYTTESYKLNWPSDGDGLEVRMVLTDEPTTSEVPRDGVS